VRDDRLNLFLLNSIPLSRTDAPIGWKSARLQVQIFRPLLCPAALQSGFDFQREMSLSIRSASQLSCLKNGSVPIDTMRTPDVGDSKIR
jgi:hypothetical protein